MNAGKIYTYTNTIIFRYEFKTSGSRRYMEESDDLRKLIIIFHDLKNKMIK